MNKETVLEYTRKISQANRTGIIVIIYDLADVYLEDAKEAHEAGDWDAYTEACHQAKKCLNHLLDALDDSYKLSALLTQFYIYQNKEISMACARRDLERLMVVRHQLKEVGESFRTLAEQDESQSVMQNSQAVYAGLTYGRGQLNESYDSTGRGFEA